jgi:long-chain acyl-CoA synthetase
VGRVVVEDVHDGGVTFLIAVPLLFDKVMNGIDAELKKLPGIIRLPLNALRGMALKKAKEGNPEFGQRALRFIRKKAKLDSIRMLVAGGGALDPNTADFFDSLGFNMVHGYGMSENGPLISVNTPHLRRNASVGLPVRHTLVKIVDQDDSSKEITDSSPDKAGEIICNSPSMMLGYYNHPEATAEVFFNDAQGVKWLLTGDLGYRDAEGFIYICGRKKNLIVSSGGKNIYPEEIESHFNSSRLIGEILVAPHKRDGSEEVVAMIYPNWEALKADKPDIKEGDDQAVYQLIKLEVEKVNRTLPGYKKIQNFKLVDEPFQKNAQSKIRRFFYKDTYDKLK